MSPVKTLEHSPYAPAVAWRPDGKVIATGDLAGDIRLWAVEGNANPTAFQTIAAHTDPITTLDFSPDGRNLVSGSVDTVVKVWDTTDASLQHTITDHRDWVFRAVWSADGTIVASSSRDATIRLWDIQEQRYRGVLRGHVAVIRALTFAPDGKNLLSGGDDGTIRVWDIDTMACIQIIPGYAAGLQDISWRADGKALTSSGANGLITLYDLASDLPPRTLRGHKGAVIEAVWSYDGRIIASNEYDKTIRLWDAHTGTQLEGLHLDNDAAYCDGLSWHPHTLQLVAGSLGNGVLLFDFESRTSYRFVDDCPDSVARTAFSPDGRLICGISDDNTLHIWEYPSGNLLNKLTSAQGNMWSLSWSLNSAYVATCGWDEKGSALLVWDVKNGNHTRINVPSEGVIATLQWGNSDTCLLTYDNNSKLYWWNVQTGECIRSIDAGVDAMKRSPDGTLLVISQVDGQILVYDVLTGDVVKTMRSDRPYERLDITGVWGLTDAQKTTLIELGAFENA
jgi:WD40 repeat protein